MRVATPTSGEGNCLLLTAPQAIVDEHMAQLAAPSAGTSASDEADVRRWFGHIDDELPDEGQMDAMDLAQATPEPELEPAQALSLQLGSSDVLRLRERQEGSTRLGLV